MTITAEQLDELERKAKAASPGPYRWGLPVEGEPDLVQHRHAMFAPNRAASRMPVIALDSGSLYLTLDSDCEHIAANSPDVTLHLVAIARAALAMDRATVLAVLSEELGEYGLHTGGSYGVELDYNDKYKILETVADRIVTALRGAR